MSDPQQPGEGAQSPQDPTANPSTTPGQDASSDGQQGGYAPPPPASYGGQGDYTPPSYTPGQPAGSAPAPSSAPQPPVGSAPEAPPAPGYAAYPGQAPTSGAYAAYPGAAQAGGPGQPGSPYGGQAGSPYGGSGQPPKSGKGLAIAAVAVGGAALLFSWVPFFGLVLALVGLALGIVTLVRKGGSKLLGWIGTGLSALAALISVVVLIFTFAFANEVNRQIEEGSPSFTSPAEPSSPSDEATDDESDSASGDESADSSNASFGETVTYDDGLAVTVSAPEAFTPGEYAVGADQAANVVFTITIANGTSENYDPSFAYPSVSSGGVEATDIYDSDSALDQPRTAVPAGQSVSWKAAFSVADPGAVVLQISPDSFDYDDVVYQN